MNEVQFIRRQLDTERGHLQSVRTTASEAVLEVPGNQALLLAAASYLVAIGRRHNEQDRAHLSVLTLKQPPERDLLDLLATTLAASERAVEIVHSQWSALSTGQITLETFISACGPSFADISPLPAHERARVNELCQRGYSIPEWRATTRIDTETIMDERKRYAEVTALMRA